MQKNFYERTDNYFDIFGNSEENIFTTIGQVIKTDIPRFDNSSIFFEFR